MKLNFDITEYRVFYHKYSDNYFAIKRKDCFPNKLAKEVNHVVDFLLVDKKGNLTDVVNSINSNELIEKWVKENK